MSADFDASGQIAGRPRIAKAYPERGPLQQFRLAETMEFTCLRCHVTKRSRLIAPSAGDWSRLLCNGCYGELISQPSLEARPASTTNNVVADPKLSAANRNPTPLFEDYVLRMKRLPQDPDEGDVVNRQFLLGRYHAHPARRGTRPRRFDVYYAPLHGFQDQAKVVLIGVTPGIQQMLVAFREARRLLHQGAAAPGIYHLIRRRMAFAGQTRVNLIRLLEAVQLPQMLGLSGAGELFGRASSLLHSTSALRYPVLVNGANYTGHNPPIRRLPSEIRSYLPMLSDQLNGLPDALVVPLGPAVEEALRLIDFNERRVLTGFPHPSGANRGRHATFVRQRAPELRRVLGAASL